MPPTVPAKMSFTASSTDGGREEAADDSGAPALGRDDEGTEGDKEEAEEREREGEGEWEAAGRRLGSDDGRDAGDGGDMETAREMVRSLTASKPS